jgi:TolA-binding protein
MGNQPVRFQLKKLLWPLIVAVLLAILIITNLMLIRHIRDLRSRLAEATADDTRHGTRDTEQEEETSNLESGTLMPKADRETQQNQPVKSTEPPDIEPSQKPRSSVQEPNTAIPITASQIAEVYNRALADCRSGRYDQAMEGFQQILEYPISQRDPGYELKDNAQYWMAECYYAQKKYVQALAEFQKVKDRFPEASKVFDAELKIAYTYCKLGRIPEAEQKLLELSKDWTRQPYVSQIAVLSKKIRSGQYE